MKKETPGINCPKCGYPMRVYRTAKLANTIYRTRICDNCDNQIKTEEKTI